MGCEKKSERLYPPNKEDREPNSFLNNLSFCSVATLEKDLNLVFSNNNRLYRLSKLLYGIEIA